LFFIKFSSFKPDTENIANFDAISLSSKCCNINKGKFLKHTPKLIIGTYNLQTFKHNKFINESRLKQFYFINIRPTLHHRKWWKLRVTLPVNTGGGSNAERAECRMMKYPKCGLNAEWHWAECRTGGMPKGLNAEY